MEKSGIIVKEMLKTGITRQIHDNKRGGRFLRLVSGYGPQATDFARVKMYDTGKIVVTKIDEVRYKNPRRFSDYTVVDRIAFTGSGGVPFVRLAYHAVTVSSGTLSASKSGALEYIPFDTTEKD